ncbi:glycoside hydrolase family 26 protein [Halorubrum sodomense]|uniref:GH26 domain-containing protein n=1 Tax=Halorubrum sodomense TaxID=35743 RepID=A0A1I6H409_HALSD|nr:glycosyl hydrolase [Halorubrum sodomense]SFR49051.1 hypothetical protein SAMN04487937_2408 [Halorubrum sodomense]
MNRRGLLAATGTAVTVTGYGTYRSFVRDDRTRDGWLLLGVTPASASLQQLDRFERWLGADHAVTLRYADMGAAAADIRSIVHGQLESIWHRRSVPQLVWQPHFGSGEETSTEINREIAAGDHDAAIEEWASTLAEWIDRGPATPDRRLYLNLAPEMNGDWSPWSPVVGAGTEADFVDMWRHVHDTVMDAGLDRDHVRWIWAIDTTTKGVDVSDCYPGDEYVDWTGIHGYNWSNWGGWRSPKGCYGRALATLRSIAEKPIGVTEFACSSEDGDGHDPERKGRWIRDVFEYFEEHGVQMACWFNTDKRTDWAVFGGDRGTVTAEVDGKAFDAYEKYRGVAGDPGVLGSHPNHPRVLTNKEFAGEF